ncbi:MAG TPA: acetylxylan esterase [Candidatus Avipropionibacterium avicola]|uniref:Acetylxylan esterase n=1 Tax=Candidatus Avipropionibacterium avicola TaxID=2840701 RepID=A0A9D1GY62_9ACTN|nr:acetylxylan esterase [Candidatus Avipropionibacterium avicola]
MMTRLSGAEVAATLIDVEFDPTYGYDLAALLECGPPEDEPDDLDAFWGEVRNEALAVDLDLSLGSWREVEDGAEVATLTVTGLDGVRLGGWAVREPGELRRGIVLGHGYGGRAEPGLGMPAGTLSVQLVARGMPGSETDGIGSVSSDHVLSGIESPRTYSHVGSAADQWTATTVLSQLAPGVPIGYEGGSFGGGIGALAAAYEDRWDALVLSVPSFGNHPLRLQLPCRGSGNAVRLHSLDHPEVSRVLRYVDAANAATRVHVPALCLPALADPSVPPPGQFAVATALAGPTWIHVKSGGHGSWDGDQDEQVNDRRMVARFWDDPVAATRD